MPRGRKRIPDEVRQNQTLMRATRRFVEQVKKGAQFNGLSIVDYCDSTLLPIIIANYNDQIVSEAGRIKASVS